MPDPLSIATVHVAKIYPKKGQNPAKVDLNWLNYCGDNGSALGLQEGEFLVIRECASSGTT